MNITVETAARVQVAMIPEFQQILNSVSFAAVLTFLTFYSNQTFISCKAYID